MTGRDGRRSVGLVIPTLNAGEGWVRCLEAIRSQSFRPDRSLIMDSASTDGTVALATSAGFEVVRIERSEFNHGGTRQRAAELLSDCEIIVFLTQDAILAADDALEKLMDCFDDPEVAIAYGRQIPHVNAGAIASHARLFNYGPQTVKKNAATARMYGTKVFFCSNSFAAYNRELLLTIGGFRVDLILGEDMEFAARAINAGYVNMYCAAARAHHSHDYTMRQTLARYFDIGVFDSKMPWLRERFGSHSGEGRRFVQSELTHLWRTARGSIPLAIFQTAAKWLGYRLGRLERNLPFAVKKKLSMMPSFWQRTTKL